MAKIYTIQEAARALGMSPWTLRNRIKTRGVKLVLHGNTHFVYDKDFPRLTKPGQRGNPNWGKGAPTETVEETDQELDWMDQPAA